jgi:PKD repeat protein
MSGVFTYTEVKEAMAADGYTVSEGSAWQGQDQGTFNTQFIPAVTYAAATPGQYADSAGLFAQQCNYGMAYPAVFPSSVAAAIASGAYSATIAGNVYAGNSPFTVTFTATETNGPASSYLWNFGDGDTATTTVNNTTHQYAAGSTTTFNKATMTPTVDGKQLAAVTAPTAATVIVYSATAAGAPLTGTHGTTAITWTLTETGKPTTGTNSYSWNLGDGSQAQVTSVPTITYTYAAAGSYTAVCTPTIDGVAQTAVTAAAPAVIS